MKRAIRTPNAPKPVGPYSQAVEADGTLWISMQLPLEPDTGELIEGDVGVQMHRVLQNLRAILEADGVTLNHVVRTGLYLVDPADFAEVNRVTAEYFTNTAPTRSAIYVTQLPRGAKVALDAVAVV